MPVLVERQLGALAAAAAEAPCDVWVMAPTMATADEAARFVTLARDAGLATAVVMVEVPAVALQAEALMEVVDVTSIGTKTCPSTFAADRRVGELGTLLDPWQPALLRLVGRTAEAGRAARTPVGICGEVASDALLALVLVGLGCTSLSMAASAIPAVRMALAGQTSDAAGNW